MAYLIQLPSFSDERGNLTVLDDVANRLPFEVKRVFYIHNVSGIPRAGHRHFETREAVICVSGHCRVSIDNGRIREDFLIKDPFHSLIIEPEDWRTLHHFSEDAVILVFASTVYDKDDYIFEPYSGLSCNPVQQLQANGLGI